MSKKAAKLIVDSKQTEIALAENLYTIIEMRKDLEKKEKNLKEHFKVLLEKSSLNNILIGGFLILVDVRRTTTIDRTKLKDELGEDRAKDFERETVYEVLTIKVA